MVVFLGSKLTSHAIEANAMNNTPKKVNVKRY